MCLLGWFPIHLDSGAFKCCFRLKVHPFVSLAFPPVDWLAKDRGIASTQSYCLCMAEDFGDHIAFWALTSLPGSRNLGSAPGAAACASALSSGIEVLMF